MKKIIILSIASVIFWSCEKPIILDVNQVNSKIIIEGQVTNKPGHQYVKVSRSGGFYDTGNSARITNAIVTVSDNEGNIFPFDPYLGNKSDSAGYYLPQP